MLEHNLRIRRETTKIGKLTFYNFVGHQGRATQIFAPESSHLQQMTELNKVLATTKCNEFTEVEATVADTQLTLDRPVLISANIQGINEWMFVYGQIQYLSREWCYFELPTDPSNPLSQLRNGYTDCGHADVHVPLRYFVASNYV